MDIDYSSLFLQVIPPWDGTSRRFIDQFIHVDFFDLTALVCVELETGKIPVPKATASDLDLSEGDLIMHAAQNMAKAFPAMLETSNGALRRLLAELEAEGIPRDDVPQVILDVCVGFVVTADNGGDPAAVLFYPDILANVAKKTGLEDYYIFFSSVDELLVFPGTFPHAAEAITEIHTGIQAQMKVDPDMLGKTYSDSIYHYDHGRVSMIIKGKL